MEPRVKNVLLGVLGERIVSNYFTSRGYKVNESISIFDSTGDMKINNRKVEVKTQVPFFTQNAFSFPVSQLGKIKNAYRVYWVSVPYDRIKDKYEGFVYEMDPKKINYKLYTKNSGSKIYLVERSQEGIKPLFKINDPKIIGELKKLSNPNIKL